MYRPRVERWEPEGIDDVQRLLLVLSPERKPLYRVIAAGRKRLPSGTLHQRFWGYVDLVLRARQDLRAALGAHTYLTKTRGLRHLPAAAPAGKGRYEIVWHNGHAHLEWQLTTIESDDPVVRDLHLEPAASAIVTVANPDPTVWGLLEPPPLQFDLFDDSEVHVAVPTPFPPHLQKRFGERRFLPLDTLEFLDHPGAELIFVATPS